MHIGVLFALAAYGAYACGDAIIKGIGPSLTPFEIAFWATLPSLLPVLATKPREELLRHALATKRAWTLSIRGVLGFIAANMVIYAFTHIPLAETYALVFLTPTFSTILAVTILKEEMTPRRWIGLLLGFAGVMLVVRPGFRELELGHLSAAGCALFASVAAILLRQVSQTEKRTAIIGYAVIVGLVLNGIIILLTSARLPTAEQLGILTIVGLLGGFGHVFIVSAARTAPAAWVAQTQYSQIVWAIALGAIFYAEYPQPLTLLGLGVVVLAGLVNFRLERARTWFGAHPVLFRRRRDAHAKKAAAEQPKTVSG